MEAPKAELPEKQEGGYEKNLGKNKLDRCDGCRKRGVFSGFFSVFSSIMT